MELPLGDEFNQAVFKMEIDIPPLGKKKFVFTSYYLDQNVVSECIHCEMCACGSCKCKYPPDDVLDGECLTSNNKDLISNGPKKLTLIGLRELYMNFIGDIKEWNSFVTTSHLVEKKNKNEINMFSSVPTGDTVETDDVQRLTDYERWATMGILKELIDKLVILGTNKPKVTPKLNFHPPKVRYHAKIRKRLYDSDTNMLISDGEGPREICRFQKFRTLLEHVVKITRDEIRERSTCDALQGFLSLEDRRLMEENAIHNYYNDSISLIKTLKKIKIRNDVDTKIVIDNLEEEKKELKKELQNEMFRYGLYLSYIKDWADAEHESEKWDKDEHFFKWIENELKRCEETCNVENRVHRDVVMFLKLSMKKLDKDVKKWSLKYEKDMEEKDSEISTLKQKRRDIHNKMSQMVGIFERRHSEIQSYLKERAERQRKAAEKKRRDDAATKIQAWWRGTMVRWEFGKYDQDKNKKKKAKSKASRSRK